MQVRKYVALAVSAVALAGGILATPAVASASAPAPETAVSGQNVSVMAVNNLGLSRQQARYVQCYLRVESTYNGAIDGLLGSGSWAAMQRELAAYWGYPANQIDGIVGPNTIRALQRMLAYGWDYNAGIDGDAGPGTRAAFKRFANDQYWYYTHCYK